MANTDLRDEFVRRSKLGRWFGGLIIIAAGVLMLMKEMGYDFPEWLFSWSSLGVVACLFWGAKYTFRPGFWMLIFLVSIANFLNEAMPGTDITNFAWPVIIIVGGLFVMFAPYNKWRSERKARWDAWKEHKDWNRQDKHEWKKQWASYGSHRDEGDYLDSTSIFGGVKKNFISKDFKGGEVVCVFGGADINLMQADIKDTAELNLTMVFGGAKLIVPSNWIIKHEMTNIMGGIDDKRPQIPAGQGTENRRILILTGEVIFGGIDIRSY